MLIQLFIAASILFYSVLPSYAQLYPNKPAALNPIFEYNGNILPLDNTMSTVGMTVGYGNKFNSKFSIVSDSTAPVDGSLIMRYTIPSGQLSGTDNGQLNFWNTAGPRVPVNAYYEAMWIKVVGNGTNFEVAGDGPWKLGGFWGVGDPPGGYSGGMYMLVDRGNDLGTITNTSTDPDTVNQLSSVFNLAMVRQSTSSELVRREGGGQLLLGVWYRLEFYFVINDIGSANGIMKVWLTTYNNAGAITAGPTLVINWSNWRYRNAAYPHAFWVRHYSPTSGGRMPNTKTRDDFLHIAKFAGFGSVAGGGDITKPTPPTGLTAQ